MLVRDPAMSGRPEALLPHEPDRRVPVRPRRTSAS